MCLSDYTAAKCFWMPYKDNDTDLILTILTTLQFMTYKSILGWRLLLTFCHDKEEEEEESGCLNVQE